MRRDDTGSSTTTADRCIEIACDESGFSGGSLLTGQTRVFAHASVHVDGPAAAALVDELRERIGAPPGEYKAARLLRTLHRPVLLWLLGPTSPLHGRARVHLTDTRFFLVARLLDVLLGGHPVAATDCPGSDPTTRSMALVLHRNGAATYGPRRWTALLSSAANLLRTRSRWLPNDPVERFFAALDELLGEEAPAEIHDVLGRLSRTRTLADTVRATHEENRKRAPLLEPLIPALTRSVHAWGEHADTVSVVHDEQSALTPERIADIARAFAGSRPGRRLVEVRRVDSRDDPRIQVADFVAGIARRVASEELVGHPDPELADLLRPVVDPRSVWTTTPFGRGPIGSRAGEDVRAADDQSSSTARSTSASRSGS